MRAARVPIVRPNAMTGPVKSEMRRNRGRGSHQCSALAAAQSGSTVCSVRSLWRPLRGTAHYPPVPGLRAGQPSREMKSTPAAPPTPTPSSGKGDAPGSAAPPTRPIANRVSGSNVRSSFEVRVCRRFKSIPRRARPFRQQDVLRGVAVAGGTARPSPATRTSSARRRTRQTAEHKTTLERSNGGASPLGNRGR